MSGDFVDYFAIDRSRAGFYMADVSGHGVASAFVTVYLKRFVASALEAKRQGQPSVIDDPAALLSQLNHELLRERVGKHIAIWYAVLDVADHSLRYANAGATPFPLCADADGTHYLETPSTPAGLFDHSAYVNETKALPERFRLLLSSDGVLELLPEPTSDGRAERLRLALRLDTVNLDAVRESLQIKSDGARPDDLALLLHDMTDAISSAVNDDVGYLRLSGELRHDTAGALETLIERWFDNDISPLRGVVVDLNEATFMDSTVIGLLASIARELQARDLPRPTVFSTKPEINQLLRSLRLDDALMLVERNTGAGAVVGTAERADAQEPDGQCSGAAILKAHQTLIDINEANRAAFQPVVDLFRKDLS